MTQALLVDGHVHYHPCFGVEPFLEAARANFEAARGRLGLTEPALGCLLFSESAWHCYFREFAEGLVRRSTRDWTVETTEEDCSIIAYCERRPIMILVAGRQIVTAERLEVLALASSRTFSDGEPIDEVVEKAVLSGAVTVLPWGFGKWFGKRGRTIARILESTRAGQIYLGDNSGRPALAPEPHLFAVARAKGVPVLPGSDPLPFKSQARNAGRYGFVLEGSVDMRTPAATIRQKLLEQRLQPRRYGRLESLPNFVRSQVRMQLLNRMRQRGVTAPSSQGARS